MELKVNIIEKELTKSGKFLYLALMIKYMLNEGYNGLVFRY